MSAFRMPVSTDNPVNRCRTTSIHPEQLQRSSADRPVEEKQHHWSPQVLMPHGRVSQRSSRGRPGCLVVAVSASRQSKRQSQPTAGAILRLAFKVYKYDATTKANHTVQNPPVDLQGVQPSPTTGLSDISSFGRDYHDCVKFATAPHPSSWPASPSIDQVGVELGQGARQTL